MAAPHDPARNEPRLLLERILRSAPFRGDDRLSRALIDLANGAPDVDDVPALRTALRSYFAGEGRAERLRVAIPADQDRLYFYEAEPEDAVSPLLRFWQPHLAGERNVLLHGLTAPGAVDLDEMYTVLCIATWLQDQGGSLEVRPAEDNLPTDAELILTGTSATNSLVDEDEYPVRRSMSASGRAITWIRDLRAARVATDEAAIAQAASPFPDGFPPEFGLKF